MKYLKEFWLELREPKWFFATVLFFMVFIALLVCGVFFCLIYMECAKAGIERILISGLISLIIVIGLNKAGIIAFLENKAKKRENNMKTRLKEVGSLSNKEFQKCKAVTIDIKDVKGHYILDPNKVKFPWPERIENIRLSIIRCKVNLKLKFRISTIDRKTVIIHESKNEVKAIRIAG